MLIESNKEWLALCIYGYGSITESLKMMRQVSWMTLIRSKMKRRDTATATSTTENSNDDDADDTDTANNLQVK